ncbi:215_t:CDS:2 [Funneliformis caledonium]|uniref:215_t:CDS:1 n=1 Tax=Funneliformis caledonium TaxID=1117310 RepID=A0A9N9GKH5_9GLOM|nr:215_t:CDS:2 [Funneliformis caledonium]
MDSYQCSKCEKVFNYLSSLQNYRKTHSKIDKVLQKIIMKEQEKAIAAITTEQLNELSEVSNIKIPETNEIEMSDIELLDKEPLSDKGEEKEEEELMVKEAEEVEEVE